MKNLNHATRKIISLTIGFEVLFGGFVLFSGMTQKKTDAKITYIDLRKQKPSIERIAKPLSNVEEDNIVRNYHNLFFEKMTKTDYSFIDESIKIKASKKIFKNPFICKINPNDYDILGIKEDYSNNDSFSRDYEERIDNYIKHAFEKLKKIPEIITKDFIKSIAYAESKYNIYAESKDGARGLMQLMEETWNDMEKEIEFESGVFNPYENVKVGTKYLIWLNNYCEERYPKWNGLSQKEKHLIIAAAYNAGHNKLKRKGWRISKMPEETKYFIKEIDNNFR